MPRLVGYREKSHKDLYDGYDVSDVMLERGLFANPNLGDPFVTNMTTMGQLPGDQTYIVLGMRVRSNISRLPMSVGTKEVIRDAFLVGDDDTAIGMIMNSGAWERSNLTKAFDEYLHATTATLLIGQRPWFETNLYDLLTSAAVTTAFDEGDLRAAALEVNGYRNGGRQFARPFIIPVRQSFCVRLVSSQTCAHALAKYAAKANIAPRPMIWMHLDGILTRDAA